MRGAGLIAARTTVARFEDQSAIVIARYDRRAEGRSQVRVHQEDMCQALAVHPARKYQNDGGPGPGDIAALLRRVMPLPRARAATLGFLEALIWNWIIAGTDGHAKNYSLLLLENQLALAPFYDVASSLPYGWPEQKTRLAMKFGSDYRISPGSRPWGALAKTLQVAESEVIDKARRLVDVAPKAFESAASDPSLARLDSPLPDRLVALVSKRAKKCARYL